MNCDENFFKRYEINIRDMGYNSNRKTLYVLDELYGLMYINL